MQTETSPLFIPLFMVSGVAVSPALLLGAGAVLLLFVLLAVIMVAGRNRRAAEELSAALAAQAHAAEARLAEIVRAQSEMQGRMSSMAEIFGTRQAELNKAIGDRLDGMSHRLGNSMTEQTKATHENLRRLQERLAVIDTAQNNIQSLAKDVVGLQAILSNKQTRGAFGQSRMETIIADGLPMGAYEFQATLSDGSRPDCLVRMPNGQPSLVVDAKFPLEAYNAIRDAGSPEAAKLAAQNFRRDLEKHISDIAQKYLIKGETQDIAFMFVPSESIFAEIHENFEGVVQKAHKARVVIVSPSLLMLSLQVIQSVLKDQRMREQAHLIQGEVVRLMEDMSRLDDRVQKLQTHFAQTQKDVELIATSTTKLMKRGAKIEEMEFETLSPAQAAEERGTASRPVESRTAMLKLRVVDEE
ncbi:DNA recombination protein RmuC [Rhizobium aquaticum]|uniref:DNA recombination protein RmuC homolog n=1 Tax=Rhizobium aquaticum TaxID=1549636 RepID=A0ABV2J0Y5_9HYPH